MITDMEKLIITNYATDTSMYAEVPQRLDQSDILVAYPHHPASVGHPSSCEEGRKFSFPSFSLWDGREADGLFAVERPAIRCQMVT
jgi:hypothetical protein